MQCVPQGPSSGVVFSLPGSAFDTVSSSCSSTLKTPHPNLRPYRSNSTFALSMLVTLIGAAAFLFFAGVYFYEGWYGDSGIVA
jgi:hypothetical protein